MDGQAELDHSTDNVAATRITFAIDQGGFKFALYTGFFID